MPEVRPASPGVPGALPLEEISFNYGKIEWTYTLLDHETGKPLSDVKAYWNLFTNQGG